MKECPDCFEITVSDDGVGFVTGTENEEGKTHVGIRNVRQRLDILCHARLEIKSEPGRGTTAVIYIPKENQAFISKNQYHFYNRLYRLHEGCL